MSSWRPDGAILSLGNTADSSSQRLSRFPEDPWCASSRRADPNREPALSRPAGVSVTLMLIPAFDWPSHGPHFVVSDVAPARSRLMAVVPRILWAFVSGSEMDSGAAEAAGCDCLCFRPGSEKGNLDEWPIAHWARLGADAEPDPVGSRAAQGSLVSGVCLLSGSPGAAHDSRGRREERE